MFQSTLIRRLGSLRLTCVGLALLALTVAASHFDKPLDRQWLALPLGLLSVNLLAALLTDPRLRRHRALMFFHIALLAVLGLAGAGLLLEFEGHLEMAEGQSFEWESMRAIRRGAWFAAPSRPPSFTQGSLDVRFEEGTIRQETRSVLIPSDSRAGRQVVADGASLRIDGYDVSTSANKGFAVMLQWRDDGGDTMLGVLNMPSFPAMEWKQSQQWRTPAGERVEVSLSVPSRSAERWNLRALLPGTSVQLRTTDGHRILRTGETVAMQGGTLTLVDVRLWMGYRISRQPTLMAMLFCSMLGIGALGWHVLRKHFADVEAARRTDGTTLSGMAEARG